MPTGFSRLSVKGYRRLKSVDIQLRPLNVLIGGNGVGKSTVLDVLRVVAASAGGGLQAAVAQAGAFPMLLTADGSARNITITLVTHQDDEAELIYELRLLPAGFSYSLGDERLTLSPVSNAESPIRYIKAQGTTIHYFQDGNAVEPDSDYNHAETALSQIPKSFRKATSFKRTLMDVSEIYHTLDVSVRSAVRTPQVINPVQTPGVNGEELVSCLYTMRETVPDRFESVEDALRAAFPAFEKLEFPPVAAGLLTIAWRERGFTRPFYASELSEGTLRFLWLATLLQSPGLPQVTLIDEPEVSLHPELLRILTELMREASERTQLVVATHSDRLVRFLRPEELIACDLDENGSMTVQWADRLGLQEWLEDYTLDQLWSMGRLGGRS
jgi:predicted ATPase